MLTEDPDLDVLVVPIGGGGLIGGIATIARDMRPNIRIVGVQTELYPAMKLPSPARTSPAAARHWPRGSRSRSRAA